ncbi:hypothetical protein UFOVP806_8 [uncultured Caudovirales phage]|uniref:Uncharacterized protein n=1 Tax=uncultured Caudovirales phage TaxID=2100421 RepID=A0A6J5P1X1_9CAUD|nr:hypothetical protein UFOVP806_8 [uncultured Caudovirales phage]
MAKPMTLGAYNELRGWEIPLDENPETPGYLVEYQDGGKANHPDFAGYISWSPAEVFEKAYWPSESPKDRLEAELKDLHERIEKLNGFLETQACKDLPALSRAILLDQQQLMLALEDLLKMRLTLWPR